MAKYIPSKNKYKKSGVTVLISDKTLEHDVLPGIRRSFLNDKGVGSWGIDNNSKNVWTQ